MKIAPLGDRILIEPLSEEERGSKTASGIFIPDTAKERPEEGKVVAVGPGRMSKTGTLIPVQHIKVGDRVLFTKYGPNEIKVDGKEYLIAREEDILAVLNN